jgi:hypothetical protein
MALGAGTSGVGALRLEQLRKTFSRGDETVVAVEDVEVGSC